MEVLLRLALEALAKAYIPDASLNAAEPFVDKALEVLKKAVQEADKIHSLDNDGKKKYVADALAALLAKYLGKLPRPKWLNAILEVAVVAFGE